jgi:hypothetical protein
MRPRSLAIPLLVAVAGMIGPSRFALAGGLSCSVGEVVIENLQAGQRYSLRALANLPLSITNNSDQAMRVCVDPLVPGAAELRQGAEPIPDATWASALPETLEIPAHQTRAAELFIHVPDRAELRGRKFEVVFWSHNMPQPGELLAYGLKSRVIFSIDREAAPPQSLPEGDLSLTLQPAELRLEGVVPGRMNRLEDLTRRPLKVRNTSSRTVRVSLHAVSAKAAGVTEHVSAIDLMQAGVLSLSEPEMTLAPGEERTVEGTLRVAKGKAPKGRNLVCVIGAAVIDQPVRTEIYSRVTAHTR